ncbi:transcription-repair coupling factor [Spirochaeta thermophila DSM 6578]|uniref:Transcription-repair-coupling factor n=1 Tax=Winmispira thermophila (strain ATCC 700085 / DSM 6578 / Z-1203) TaxID=869211 RepID=G0GER2_WINT7|nr:transcription-repair coupling factor [Spirochaeta thermophila]AEJ61468.1 transcription-repair coupling factor [Spirochaeta thermophila DSM 6578]
MDSLFFQDIFSVLSSSRAWKELLSRYNRGEVPIGVRGVQGGFSSFFLARLSGLGRPLCVVFPTEKEAEDAVESLRALGVEAGCFPEWGITLYGEGLAEHAPVFGRRAEVLARLLAGELEVVCTSLRAFLWRLPPADRFRERLLVLRKGQQVDPAALAGRLVEMGYFRVPRVSLRGECAVRGEVVDVFAPGEEGAFRLVVDFDRIEHIRLFDPSSQRTLKEKDLIVVPPLREYLWDEEGLSRVREALKARAPRLDVDGLVGELAVRGRMQGEELYWPLAYESPSSLLEYVPGTPLLLLMGKERLLHADEAYRTELSTVHGRVRHLRPVPTPEDVLLPFSHLETRRDRIEIFLLEEEDSMVHFSCEGPRVFFGNVNFLKEELSRLLSLGYRVYVLTDSEPQRERLAFLLREFPDVKVELTTLSTGFVLPEAKRAVFHENEIFGRRRRTPASVKRVKSAPIDSFVELSPGDYVVHVHHGIGRFLGIKRMKVGENERDYLHLEYAGEEYVFVPIEQVNLVQRYIGSSDAAPRLDKLGSSSWQKRKERVKKSVEDLAKRLLAIYSRRKLAHGFAFPPDTEWQMEFEARFPFEETEDQLRCIEEVKRDMESPRPMDRLVCGDVGFGKTEIALRAAFKAVTAGKQVAILAPTTILVEQHYETFQERLEGFPVRAAMLSRFVPVPEQKEILKALREGKIDILIGTHRILQKDVVFKDLGLLVIDEEQRFGVKDKERLKELKASVDCLTLTATPIPRTLHMSLLKIRDISLLETPPRERRPIETHILEFSEEVIARAIRREVERGGQVFYLHNRVETLPQVKTFIERLVPEVMVEVAHGKMSSHQLEEIMHRFIHGGFHVLVSTTIIENGINIPNANTIIIDRADMYGIAQLYQLRGRVGRSDRTAYAYLFYPAQREISELAAKRLQVIADHTELGAGFKVALKDLEVRGAGNLLGREQSGDIHSVGFDMYLRLLDEAIRELEQKEERSEEEVYLELEYTGFIPDCYIQEPQEKMVVYKKIVSVRTEEDLAAVQEELEDRYGPLPPEVASLLGIAELQILAKKLAIRAIRERKGEVEVEFGKVSLLSPDKVLRLIREGNGRIRLDPHRPHVLRLTGDSVGLKEKAEYLVQQLGRLL